MAKTEYSKQSTVRHSATTGSARLGLVGRRTASSAAARTRAISSTRTVPRLTNAQKVEELKLGKFEDCQPLRLPQKQIRRGWQLVWSVVLLLVALVGAYALWRLVLGYGGLEEMVHLKPHLWVMIGGLAVATLMAFLASIILLAKRRVPALFWYILIIAATVAVLCVSYHSYTWYEARWCYENYPSVKNGSGGCPSVVNDLILISVRNLVIYTVGIVAFCSVRRVVKRHKIGRKKQKA